MTIGLSRALFYWKQPGFWETFFKELGFEVILSPATNKEIIEQGVKTADSETCFSIKVLYGHLLFLEGKVDYIFLPRFKKNELGEYCPKFFGLPDLAALFLKTRILAPKIDLTRDTLKQVAFGVGRKFHLKDKLIYAAFKKALATSARLEEENQKEYQHKISSPAKKVVLISHPYNLYDHYVNLDVKDKLEKLGAQVIFIDEVPLAAGPIELPVKFHWEFGQEMVWRSQQIAKEKINGAVEISAFQCGCDAVVKEFVEREFTQKKIPFLYLLIDEQTAEAGLQTRLEAFIDTLKS